MAAIDANGDGLCEIMDAEGLMGSVECWREFLSWLRLLGRAARGLSPVIRLLTMIRSMLWFPEAACRCVRCASPAMLPPRRISQRVSRYGDAQGCPCHGVL